MIRTIVLCSLIFAQIPNLAYAAPATVVHSSQFRSKPLIDAPILATIAEGESVELLGNDGGWSRIKTSDGKIGFVRLLNIRPVTAGKSNSAAGIGTLGNVVRTGSTGAIATTGVKGMTKDDVAKSTPNPAEVSQMERYAISTDQARNAAKSVKLAEQAVPFLEEHP